MNYKPKPLSREIVEAFQWNPEDTESCGRIAVWLSQNGIEFEVNYRFLGVKLSSENILTTVEPTDWIIQDSEEIYVLSDETFSYCFEPDN